MPPDDMTADPGVPAPDPVPADPVPPPDIALTAPPLVQPFVPPAPPRVSRATRGGATPRWIAFLIGVAGLALGAIGIRSAAILSGRIDPDLVTTPELASIGMLALAIQAGLLLLVVAAVVLGRRWSRRVSASLTEFGDPGPLLAGSRGTARVAFALGIGGTFLVTIGALGVLLPLGRDVARAFWLLSAVGGLALPLSAALLIWLVGDIERREALAIHATDPWQPHPGERDRRWPIPAIALLAVFAIVPSAANIPYLWSDQRLPGRGPRLPLGHRAGRSGRERPTWRDRRPALRRPARDQGIAGNARHRDRRPGRQRGERLCRFARIRHPADRFVRRRGVRCPRRRRIGLRRLPGRESALPGIAVVRRGTPGHRRLRGRMRRRDGRRSSPPRGLRKRQRRGGHRDDPARPRRRAYRLVRRELRHGRRAALRGRPSRAPRGADPRRADRHRPAHRRIVGRGGHGISRMCCGAAWARACPAQVVDSTTQASGRTS